MSAPSANGITKVSFHDVDQVAPSAVALPAATPLAGKVELQWPGAADGSGSSGLWLYVIDRQGGPGPNLRMYSRRPNFVTAVRL